MSSPLESIVEDIVCGRDVLLTGGAGVGKTWFSRQFVTDERIRAVRLASTAMAASLIAGMTVHRFFKLGISNSVKEMKQNDKRQAAWVADKMGVTPKVAHDIMMGNIFKVLINYNCILIDEVSMLSANLINMIQYRLKEDLGIQIPILYVGDFFQLPPVDKTGDYKYAFEATSWEAIPYEFTAVKRTDNIEFAHFLNDMRVGEFNKESQLILDLITTNEYKEDSLHLFSTNNEIDSYNIAKLLELEGKAVKVGFRHPSCYDYEKCQEWIEKELNISPIFCFKIGARVLFTMNQYNTSGDLIWFNGESGHIKGFIKDYIIVEKENGVTVQVPRATYKKEVNKKGVITTELSVSQFPLRIGYAISIHKSQGMSLSSGHIDCSKFFLPQQAYVAISRFTDPNRLSISNFSKSMIVKNKRVLDYYKSSNITKFK